jgi:hypothetical protein
MRRPNPPVMRIGPTYYRYSLMEMLLFGFLVMATSTILAIDQINHRSSLNTLQQLAFSNQSTTMILPFFSDQMLGRMISRMNVPRQFNPRKPTGDINR